MIVLVSVVVLAFFSAATTERTAAHSQANSEAVRNLSNNALQFAMAQITDATKGGTAQAPLAWASQPGMIRTYDSSGDPYRYHKLYSAENMTVSDPAGFSLGEDVPPPDWRSSPAVWTDLNAPVARVDETLNYPILDPAAIDGTKNASDVYVVKPSGFTITNPPGYAGGNSTADNNRAPMPVRWLYQLKDGTLVPGTGSGNTATVAGATAANPIVGRIAFWTDDETCKVNINTAAEGTYWDTPKYASATLGASASSALDYPDYAYASFMPAQFEFQRYPGHPAQVALSTIFPSMTGRIAARLIPRLVWGGSLGGTVKATGTINLLNAPRKAPYATLDEFQFSGTATSPRLANTLVSGSAISKNDLEAAKFFSTANSRAPEVNLFNLPRVAIWPVDADLATNPASPRTTAFDRLIAFCSTLRKDLGNNAHRYFFQRSDAQSPTHDYSNIPRNQDLYSYLQRLTSAPVPGFGGNFLSKYGPDRDQILTEIFDYIRCTNLVDPNLSGFPITTPAVDGSAWPRTTNQFCQAIRGPGYNGYQLLGLGQAMPIQIGNTRGFGRIGSIYSLTLVGVCVATGSVPDSFGTTNLLANVTNDKQFADIVTGSLTTAQIRDLASNMPAINTLGVTTDPTQLPVTLTGAYFRANPGAWNYMVHGTPYPPTYPVANPKSWLKQVQAAPVGYLGGTTASNYYNPTLGGTALAHTQLRIQFYFLPTILNAGAGMVNYGADLIVKLGNLNNFNITNATNVMGGGGLFPANSPTDSGPLLKVSNSGGGRPYNNPLCTTVVINSNTRVADDFCAPWKLPAVNNRPPYYSLISMPFTVDTSSSTGLVFPGATINLSLYQGLNAHDDFSVGLAPRFKESTAPTLTEAVTDSNLIHTAEIAFPQATFPFPKIRNPHNNTSDRLLMESRLARGNEGPNGSGVTASVDLIRSMIFKGDGRVAAVTETIPSQDFTTSSNYASPTILNNGETGNVPLQAFRINNPGAVTAYISGSTSATTGDFDLGYAKGTPGPFINKPDEGDYQASLFPYYHWAPDSSNALLYTPNRIMPSPGMFGSLPTGAKAGVGWQTLLFRPQPSHPSHSTTIPDHLIMDLFWMPIVEPYAISESFSTAGKVNMNYQILPFTYINRSTALQSAMKIELMSAVPNATGYSADPTTIPWTGASGFRRTLNLSETNGTLRQFREKFAAGEIFRSASEICDVYLVPRGESWTSDASGASFWNNHLNTPENLREKPYTNLYARLTTKSNTFTVHVRAQALQKVPGTPADQWVENRDKVVGEERVSTIVERYIDAGDASLLDFATDANALLSDYYRMRVLSTKRFTP
jgi:uncharacterized protein (TIGR02600 family)